MKNMSVKISLIIAVCVFMLCLSVPAFAEKPIAFGVDASKVKVGEGQGAATWSSGQHSIATLGDNVYATWCDYGSLGSPYSVWFSMSTDGGRLWGPMVQVNDDCGSGSSIAVGSDGSIHVVWDQNNYPALNTIMHSRSTGNGGSWSTPVAVNGAFPGSWAVSVTVDTSGIVYVAWHSAGNYIYVSESSDGTSWNQIEIANGQDQYHSGSAPSIASNSSGNLYLAWECWDICFSKKMSGGLWNAPGMISGIYGEPSVAASDSGRFLIAVGDYYYNDAMVVTYSDDGGANWNTRVVESAHPNSFGNSIAVSPSGEVNIAYSTENPANECGGWGTFFERSVDGGASWNGTAYLISCHQGFPTLAIDQNNKALIMWDGASTDPKVVLFKREQ